MFAVELPEITPLEVLKLSGSHPKSNMVRYFLQFPLKPTLFSSNHPPYSKQWQWLVLDWLQWYRLYQRAIRLL